MTSLLPFSDACERNKDPILDAMRPYLESVQNVLEIGSGTGQHALHIAQACPHLFWQPTDQACYLEGLTAQFDARGLNNINTPQELDVTQAVWFSESQKFDLIYTSNTLHIMSWSMVESFFSGLYQVAKSNTLLVVYGPFTFDDRPTSPSNEAFDASLRARGVGSALRDFVRVDALAANVGFKHLSTRALPANNFCITWQL